MAMKSYKVLLTNGSTVTIPGVATVEKDGSGLRLKDADGGVIASFDDGVSRACYAADAEVEVPTPVEGGDEE